MHVQVIAPAPAARDAMPSAIPAPSPATADEPPLVYLELSTSGTQLQRRYRIYRGDGEEARRLPTDTDWSALGARLQCWSKKDGVSALQDPAFGDDLYRALFGPADKDTAGRIAAEAWRRPLDHPRHRPLQLRIITNNPLLAGLPWHRTRCDGGPVIEDGWSFALAHAIDERPADLVCRLPGRVLAFIPDGPDPESAALQHRKIDACLGNLWSDKAKGHGLHSRRIRQWPSTAASGDAPCLLYAETRGRVWRGLLQLQNGNGQWLHPEELSTGGGRPWIMFLNLEFGEDLTGPARIKGASDVCPLLIVQRHLPSQRRDAADRALQWLRAMMLQQHPIASAHRRLLATSSIYAGFHRWQPQYHDGAPLLSDHERARLRLDRHRQRSEIKDAVDKMMDSLDTRVVAAFAYGVDGNRPELFAGQIRGTLLAPRLRLQVQPRIVHQPDCDPVNGTSLNTAFYAALEADPEDPLANVLSAKRLPGPPAGDYRTLLLFHWQRGEGAAAWNKAERAAWERYCRETLTKACPSDLRILALLPLAIGDNELQRLETEVKTLRRIDRRRSDYRLVPLPPLSWVDIDEVHDFLREEMDKSFATELLEDLPHLIIREASVGDSDDEAPFEPTARVLQQGFDQGWDILRDDLRNKWQSDS